MFALKSIIIAFSILPFYKTKKETLLSRDPRQGSLLKDRILLAPRYLFHKLLKLKIKTLRDF